jgi:hypothetical protein
VAVADLYRAAGPMVAVSATEIATGRIVFVQQNFDVMCADVGPSRLSRAAGIVGGAGRAVADNNQQLRRQFATINNRLGFGLLLTSPIRHGRPQVL